MIRISKKRLYITLLLVAVGTLLLYRAARYRQSPENHTPFLDRMMSPNRRDDINDDGDVDQIDSEQKLKEIQREDDYEHNYRIAKMGFKHFKKQLMQEERKKKEGLPWEELMEDMDDEEFDDYYDEFGGFLDAVHLGDDVDDKALAKMRFVEGIRNKLKPFQLSYNPDSEHKDRKPIPTTPDSKLSTPEHQEGKPCHGLFSHDSLVRSCITNDIIGRVPGKMKTQAFSGSSVLDFSEAGRDRRDSFVHIFRNKAWGDSWDGNVIGLDASGRGATLLWTQELIAGLHIIITQLKTELRKSRIRVLDLPCGDMKWMSRFLSTREDIDYTGIDIVHDIIESHRITYRKQNWKFLELDIVEEEIPGSYDLIISRTLLQHLYSSDAARLLEKISRAGIYMFTTTFPREKYNSELEMSDNNPGRFRELNLELPPFSLEPPICLQRDGPPKDIEIIKQFMGLWKLPLKQVSGCDTAKGFNLMDTDQKLYSCMEWSPYIDWNS